MSEKTKAKKTVSKKVTPKPASSKKSSTVAKNEKQIEIEKLLKQLASAKTTNRKKSLRKQLRVLGHKGGLRSAKEKSND